MASQNDDIYGVDTSAENGLQNLKKDLTPAHIKFANHIKSDGAWIIVWFIVLFSFFTPYMNGGFLIFLLISYWIYKKNVNTKEKLPFKKRKSSFEKFDLNELHPATNKPMAPEGITFFGNERNTKKEVWFTNSDVRTHCLIFGTTGAGKALRVNEFVHTPEGWKRNKDIEVGDKISTPFGYSKVSGVFPQGELQLYRIVFEDERFIDVSADHLWEVFGENFELQDLKNGELGKAEVLDTLSIMRLMEDKDFKDLSIMLSGDIEKAKRNLKITPYLMGEMLAQGNYEGRYKGLNIADNGFVEDLYYYGLLKENLFNRFIPEDYKESSLLDRYTLVSGMLDSSGVIEDNNIYFKTTSANLANDMAEVIYSLGGFALVEDRTVEEGVYSVLIKHRKPTKLFSKKEKLEQLIDVDIEIASKLKINKIYPLDKKEQCQCIKIEDPRGLFITKDYLTTHNTETMLSLCVNSLNQYSGFIYVDGKGDNELWAKVFSLVASRGRLDDLYIINFMTSHMDSYNKTSEKSSHTMNPCATANDSVLSELFISLMPESSGDGMWSGRAAAYMKALLKPLVYLRDQGKLLLDVDVIRKYFTFEKTEELSQRKDIPAKYRDGLVQYVENLPGYVKPTPENPNVKQGETVGEQHGYITMQFTETFGLLADSYGHVMKTQLAEVDFYDIVINRRILVVLLPALEKSKQSLGNLGKIIVASIKNMMSTTLGSKVEGDRESTIDMKPTKADSPFMTIFDEYGYYSVKGAAVMPAQARGLGFFMIFAGQDYQAFKAGSEDDVGSIIANCAIKICMKLEDPKETFEIFQKAAGQGHVAEVQGFEKDTGAATEKYRASKNINVSVKDVINVSDLRNQNAGESHMLFKRETKRLKHFYAEPKLLDEVALNGFFEVEPPEYNNAKNFYEGEKNIFKKFNSILEDPDNYRASVRKSLSIIASAKEEVEVIFKFMKLTEGRSDLQERVIFSLAGYIEKVQIVEDKIVTEVRDNIKKMNEYNNDESDSGEDSGDDLDDDLDFLSGYDKYDENEEEKEKEEEEDFDELIGKGEKKEKEEEKPKENISGEDFEEKVKDNKRVLDKSDFAKDLFEALDLDYLNIKEQLSGMENKINNKLYLTGVETDSDRVKKDKTKELAEDKLLDLTLNAQPKKQRTPNSEEVDMLISEVLSGNLEDFG